MKLINLTGHPVNLNNGTEIPSEGRACVDATFGEPDNDLVMEQEFGDIKGLPSPEEGVLFIVSALVLSAGKKEGRKDLIAPATGHPDCRRNEKGQPISVPGFVR